MSTQAVTRKPNANIPAPHALEELMTPEEVADVIKMSVRYVQKHHREIGSVGIGGNKSRVGRLRFRRSSVENYLRRLRAA